MTVIINDFEVVVEPPVSTSDIQADRAQQEPTPPTMLRPQDIERIIRHFEERRDRVAVD